MVECKRIYELTIEREDEYKHAVYTMQAESLKDLETMKYLLLDSLPSDYKVSAKIVKLTKVEEEV